MSGTQPNAQHDARNDASAASVASYECPECGQKVTGHVVLGDRRHFHYGAGA